MKNLKLITLIGIAFFALALTDYLIRCPDQIYHWGNCLSWIGLIGVFGVSFSLAWMIVLIVTKKR
jgi:hypothetical protein